jgi:hypothetical protein
MPVTAGLRGKIGGNISAAVRLEGKAHALQAEGKIEEAEALRKRASDHWKIAEELKREYARLRWAKKTKRSP